MHYLPIDDNIFNWDPENMEKYWLLCRRFDQYQLLEHESVDRESQRGFQQVKLNEPD